VSIVAAMQAIALLTDFGTRDPYVAAMKGVLASRTSVPLHDLTHDIAPYDVLGAAWFLGTVARYWPAGTIFVCIVDPGVGTMRRIVAVEEEGRVFLAPDNGLLTFVWRTGNPASRENDGQAGLPVLHSVENESLFLPGGSNTFHGRDRFAPVAAALANGLALEEVGPRIDSILTLSYTPPSYEETTVRGTVVAVDRFGNVITDIDASRVPFAPFALTAHDIHLDRLEQNYGDAAPGPFLIVGSTGCIEISIANASAAERLHLRRLQRVAIIPA
jgi:S-adenosyl-L-methionine hydrolase (adenosine-forming)